MNRFALIVLAVFCSLAPAQAPRQLNIYRHSGTIDSTDFGLFDSLTIGNAANLLIHLKTGGPASIPLVQIDSLRFPFLGGPVCRVIAPNGGETYRVGDSMVIQWQVNPTPMTAQKKVCVFISFVVNPGNGSCDSCWIQLDLKGRSGPTTEPQVPNTDPRYDANHIATCKWKITNPITNSGATNQLSPISVNCKIKVGDYQRFTYNEYSDQSKGFFAIQP
jgi:hypothetical protein